MDADEAASSENETYEALRYSMSKHFMMSTIGALSEEIVGTKIASPYRLELTKVEGNDIKSLESAWYDVLRLLLPFVSQEIQELGDPYDVTRDVSNVAKVAKKCSAFVGLVRNSNPKPLQKLKHKIF